jgi:alpha-beta hydrolase superfamily lysophospholipase
MKEKTFTEKRKNIKMTLFSGDEKKPEQIVIAIHGFAGDSKSSVICEVAKELAKSNVDVLTFDLPCHGIDDCKKNLSVENCIEYVKEVENYTENKFKNIPISYFATSFGAYLLLKFLNENEKDYNKIILRSPAIQMDKILAEKILVDHNFSLKDLEKNKINLGYEKELFVDYKFYKELCDNKIDSISSKKNIFIIQGQKDNVVDWKTNEKFFKINCENYYNKPFYFKNADHRFKNKGELERIVKITKDIIVGR